MHVMPVDIVGAPVPLAAARLAILAARSEIPRETPLARDLVIILPDVRTLSTVQAAEHLASLTAPIHCENAPLRADILTLRCDEITDPRRRTDLTRCKRSFPELMRASHQSLIHIKVLVDGRDQQLLVTGAAFDQWLACYELQSS
jgi:hypothetical protein